MAFPLLPVALGGGVILLLLLAKEKKPATPPAPPPPTAAEIAAEMIAQNAKAAAAAAAAAPPAAEDPKVTEQKRGQALIDRANLVMNQMNTAPGKVDYAGLAGLIVEMQAAGLSSLAAPLIVKSNWLHQRCRANGPACEIFPQPSGAFVPAAKWSPGTPLLLLEMGSGVSEGWFRVRSLVDNVEGWIHQSKIEQA